MGKAVLLLGAILTGIGLLMTFSGVFNVYNNLDVNLIKPLTDNTTGYIASDNSMVPNYNGFDHIIMHNLAYIIYGGAVICIAIGLGQMRSGGE